MCDLPLVKHLGTIDTGLHALHEGIVLILQLLDVPLQLLGVLQQILVLLPGLHRVGSVLQLLDDVVVLGLEASVLLIHHGNSLVLIHVVVGDRAALELSVVV